MTFNVRQLSASCLDALAPSAGEAADAIKRFYRLKAQGLVHLEPKITMTLGLGHLFQSLCCATTDPPLAICKWIGVSGRNSDAGLPNVNGIAILSDAITGIPLSLIDAASLTAVRTAATSLFAAKHLARKDARTFGLIGTGVQAHSHLDLFTQAFPDLAEVRILDGHRGSEAVQAHAAKLGLRPVPCDHPRDVLGSSDILVTSVPAGGGPPTLDAAWLSPGCFVTAVDLGRSWLPGALARFHLLATDDHDNSAEQQAQGIMPPIGKAAIDLSELASGTHRGRTDDSQRTAFVFPGFALSDLAIAAHYHSAASRQGIGADVAF